MDTEGEGEKWIMREREGHGPPSLPWPRAPRSLRPALFGAQSAPNHFRPVSAPDPAGGTYDALPDPVVGWGSSPLDAFGVSISAPRRIVPIFHRRFMVTLVNH